MVPARPVLIPCFSEADSRLQNEGGVAGMDDPGSGSGKFAEAMPRLYAGDWNAGIAPSDSMILKLESVGPKIGDACGGFL